MNPSVQSLFEQAQNDPTLHSTINVNQIINTAPPSHLENKTMENIMNDIHEILKGKGLSTNKIYDFGMKLSGYRYVDEIHELHRGKHVRWIRDNTLTNGGIVVDIRFLDNGIHILCMNAGRRFIQYKFDDCITFQKLSVDEEMILAIGH